MKPIVIVDFETGGLDPERDAILGVGVVVEPLKDGWRERTWSTKIHPRYGANPVHPKAAEVNGYTPEGWEFASSEADALYDVEKLLKGTIGEGEFTLCGFNCHFDLAVWRGWVGWYFPRKCTIYPSHRVLDIHSLVFADAVLCWLDGDEVPEKMHADQASAWLGIEPEQKPHTVEGGAVWAALALRKFFGLED